MTRFYLSNATAPYDPPLTAVSDAGGTWDQAATGITKLSQIQEGTLVNSTLAVGFTTADWDKLHRRFITDPITDPGTILGTARWAIKYYEDNADLNAYPHVHVWVTQGDSNSKRGHLITDHIGTTELGTSTSPPTIDSGNLTVNPVDVVAGDRIVVEFGYRASSTQTTYLAGFRRGGTGTDAVSGDTDNTRPTWFELSGLSSLAVPSVTVPDRLGAGPLSGPRETIVLSTLVSDTAASATESGPAETIRVGVTFTDTPSGYQLTTTPDYIQTGVMLSDRTGGSTVGNTPDTVVADATPPTLALDFPVGISGGSTSDRLERGVVLSDTIGHVIVQSKPTQLAIGVVLRDSPGAASLTRTVSFVYVPPTVISDQISALVSGGPSETLERTTATLPIRTPAIVVLRAPPFRFISQHARTGRFTHQDLPVLTPEITWTLSGPVAITGSFKPSIRQLRDSSDRPILRGWSTIVHFEEDGILRASAIVQPESFQDQEWTLDALGVSSLLHGTPYWEDFSAIDIDHVDVIQELWRHVQSFPNSNLGVLVPRLGGALPVRLGTPAHTNVKEDGTTEEVAAEPFEYHPWDPKDCGSEMNSAVQAAPLNYLERSWWQPNRAGVGYQIDLLYPRAGRRRFDLRFVEGENIVETTAVGSIEDFYASAVVGVGAGEGVAAIRHLVEEIDPDRLRRVYTYRNTKIDDPRQMAALVNRHLTERMADTRELTSIVVSTDHQNAKIGTYHPGDDVYPRVRVDENSWFQAWHRITSIAYSPVPRRATLSLKRSETFAYGQEVPSQ